MPLPALFEISAPLLLLFLVAALGPAVCAATKPYNVLMIAIDDMRPELSIYGYDHMHTPNMQRLASRSVVFDRAYVQVALCMPSRTALLTSRRPDTTKDWTISQLENFRSCGGSKCASQQCGGQCGMKDLVTLPGWFLNNGYYTTGMGKIFHEGIDSGYQDFNHSWTPSTVVGPPTGIWDVGGDEGKYLNGTTPSYHAFSQPDDILLDGKLTNHAVSTLGNMSALKEDKPFFMAVGFHRPHVPWWAPERFWQYYPFENVTAPPNPYIPANVPWVALQSVLLGWSACSHGHPSKYTDLCKDAYPYIGDNYPYDNHTLPVDEAKRIRQAYWASISWTDYNIGRILDSLDASPYANDTIIALWGDHGYALMENNEMAKQTNFECATRIPFLISAPGVTPGRSSALVEEMDLFPTLVELASGSAPPRCPENANQSRDTSLCTEAFSLAPLLRSSEAQARAGWNRASFSQYQRTSKEGHPVMGYTMRLDTLRYTEWVAFDFPAARANFSVNYGVELYLHTDHPVPVSFDMENANVAGEPQHAALVAKLHATLEKCHARPDLCSEDDYAGLAVAV